MRHPNLNRKLVLEEASRTPDGAGGWSETWSAIGTHWAEMQALSGREKGDDLSVISGAGYRFILRAAPYGAPSRPRPEQRFRAGSRIFRILAVSDHDPAGRYIACHVREEVVT